MVSIPGLGEASGRAGSMPRALRFQEGWTFFADLSESTTLVLSERIAERSIVRNESSVQ